MTNQFGQMKPFGHYLRDEITAGHIDFHIRAERRRNDVFGAEREVIVFYIHPQGEDGDTQDYFIVNDENPDLLFKGPLQAASED